MQRLEQLGKSRELSELNLNEPYLKWEAETQSNPLSEVLIPLLFTTQSCDTFEQTQQKDFIRFHTSNLELKTRIDAQQSLWRRQNPILYYD